ncbi:nucleotide-diphospho-sugar transferase [Penicillium chermesinum]|nr:nucleotide-diphospho-sugar transferase [Penicillium chermesinum]
MLQLGRSPESLQGHIAQRTRWGVGLIQLMLCLKNTPQNPVPANLRWGIAYQSAVILFVLVNRTAMQIFVPLALFSGQPLVPASSPLQFKGQGILALMFVASGWLFDWLFTAKSGFHGFVFGDQREIWLSWRYLVVLFKYLFDKPRSSGSAVTGSTLNPWNHNDTGDRFAGLKRDLWDAGVMVNVLSFFAVCSAMLYAMIYTKERHGGILVGLAWPPILHMCYLIISSNWIPLACTFSPPVWENPMTAAMKPGDMDSRAMFSQTDLQRTLRPAGTRPPLGRANHYALLPVILVGLGLAVLSYCFGD